MVRAGLRTGCSSYFNLSLCFDFDFHFAQLNCFEQAVPELDVGRDAPSGHQTAEPRAAEREGRTVSL